MFDLGTYIRFIQVGTNNGSNIIDVGTSLKFASFESARPLLNILGLFRDFLLDCNSCERRDRHRAAMVYHISVRVDPGYFSMRNTHLKGPTKSALNVLMLTIPPEQMVQLTPYITELPYSYNEEELEEFLLRVEAKILECATFTLDSFCYTPQMAETPQNKADDKCRHIFGYLSHSTGESYSMGKYSSSRGMSHNVAQQTFSSTGNSVHFGPKPVKGDSTTSRASTSKLSEKPSIQEHLLASRETEEAGAVFRG